MPQFDYGTFLSQAFWLAVFFIIQYILMVKVIVPAFRNAINGRKSHIQGQVSLAEKLANEAENLKRDYEQKLEFARQENIKNMNELIDKIKKESDEQLSKLENELSQDFIKHEKRIQNFANSVADELDELALQTATNIINKISPKKIIKKDISKYIN